MEEIERSAQSVEEAVEAALEALGISEQEAVVQIVQEPRGGILGVGGHPAVVRVRKAMAPPDTEPEDEGGPSEDGPPPPAFVEEQADTAADFLEGLMEGLGLESEVEIQTVRGVTYVDVWGVESGDDMGLLIGKGGHTLDALQELVRGHVQRQTGERCLVQVDVEDYRKRRRARVAGRARDAARRVKRSGRPEALEPMTSFERKVVHDAVAEMGGLETASEGEEPNRRVVIRRRSG